MSKDGAKATTHGQSEPEAPSIIHALCALAYATEVGPNPEALAARSGFPLAAMKEITDRMRSAGLWTEHTVDRTEWSDALGAFNAGAYWNQAQVAIGAASRIVTDNGIEYVPCEQRSIKTGASDGGGG